MPNGNDRDDDIDDDDDDDGYDDDNDNNNDERESKYKTQSINQCIIAPFSGSFSLIAPIHIKIQSVIELSCEEKQSQSRQTTIIIIMMMTKIIMMRCLDYNNTFGK